MHPLAIFAAVAPATTTEAAGLSINFFWVIVAALNFIVFLALMWRFAFDPIANILADRKTAYEHVINVLDLCRRVDIWNISFAAITPDDPIPCRPA